MNIYAINITHRASEDMADIYHYISDKFQASDTAMKQYDRIASAIESLSCFPFRCKKLDFQIKGYTELRQLLIDHYSVIYMVTVLRVIYSASDLRERLQSIE